MGRNGDKGLRGKKIGTSCLVVCISPDYFLSFGLCRLPRTRAIRVQDIITSQCAQVHLFNVYLAFAAYIV